MLEGMEHVKCCGNCNKFIGRYNECSRKDIGSRYVQCPEFYYCDEFEKKHDNMVNIPIYGDMLVLPQTNDKDKLIHNMARYIAKQDIDCDICAPTIKEGGCLIEKTHSDGLDCGLDMCIECVKNWFSRE